MADLFQNPGTMNIVIQRKGTKKYKRWTNIMSGTNHLIASLYLLVVNIIYNQNSYILPHTFRFNSANGDVRLSIGFLSSPFAEWYSWFAEGRSLKYFGSLVKKIENLPLLAHQKFTFAYHYKKLSCCSFPKLKPVTDDSTQSQCL